jgi:hypothetical protein
LLPNGYGLGAQLSFWNTSTDYLDNISAWGSRAGNDNVFSFKCSLIVPLSKKRKSTAERPEEQPEEQEYTR